MFLASTVRLPMQAPSTSLSVESDSASSAPVATAALAHFDTIVRRALGHSTFGAGVGSSSSSFPWALTSFTTDDAIAFLTMLVFFAAAFLILLALKLVLGMLLLAFARSRYKGMKERERTLVIDAAGRRVGGWGVIEVDDDKKRWIYQDDPDALRASRERDRSIRERAERNGNREKERERETGTDGAAVAAATATTPEPGSSSSSIAPSTSPSFAGVSRYTMVAKRIW